MYYMYTACISMLQETQPLLQQRGPARWSFFARARGHNNLGQLGACLRKRLVHWLGGVSPFGGAQRPEHAKSDQEVQVPRVREYAVRDAPQAVCRRRRRSAVKVHQVRWMLRRSIVRTCASAAWLASLRA